MAWSRAEDEVRAFIDKTKLPFLNSPMGKGVMPDDHPLSVGAARSHALQNADLILLLGARLNWIMHFGLPPRFNPDVRVIQLDISAEQLSTNVPTEVGLVGDGKAVMAQLNAALARRAVVVPGRHAVAAVDRRRRSRPTAARWRHGRRRLGADELLPRLPRHQGSDPARRDHRERGRQHDGHRAHAAQQLRAAHRLDAGSYGTMGVGFGFAVAAAVVQQDRPVVSVSGDSAFGFSGMELETICRYNLPITTIVLNNGGIGGGFEDWPADQPLPPSGLSRTARYEKVCEAFGGQGYYVEDPADLRPTLDKAMSSGAPVGRARADRGPGRPQAPGVLLEDVTRA